MKKLFLFAAVAGLGLVSASPPVLKGDPDKPEGSAYPPCSRTVTDRCTQIHERGTMRGHHAGYRAHHGRRQAAYAAAAAGPQERARLERIRRAGNRG